jgi:hypothetical protein
MSFLLMTRGWIVGPVCARTDRFQPFPAAKIT